ncbi:MAG: heme-binding protein [Alphaproteobacteria bacterium]|nr:heme-binding protein [Alphaproteobacteria bacterium]
MRKRMIWWIIGGVAVIAAAAWGPIVSNVEQAKYEVVESQGDIQIRDYAPMIVAEAEVSGERKEAINQGFRIIADYIFGNNSPKQNVAMTAPVIQQPAEKIAMTAPVTQEGAGNSWKVRFVMPASYTMDTLPKPNNDAVKLENIPGKRFAVIRFSGMAGEESLKKYTDELNAFIKAKKLAPQSQATYAFFNPPWTLPFLRRNEVMIEIAK